MAFSQYRGIGTYVIYAEDSAFGTAGIPSGSDYVDKVTSFTANITNNMQRIHGIGEGRNATQVVNGNLDCNGNIGWELTDPAFLQYCFIGALEGAGTAADPYEVQEAERLGYASGEVNTLTLEVGSEGGANDDVMTYDGVSINTLTINTAQGDTVKCSADWIGRTGTSSTSVETYTAPTNRPFTFIDGAITVGSDTIGELTSFSMTCANNIFTYRTMGSRLISQPVAGVRRYDFTFAMKMHYNDVGSILSALEARGLVFTGVTSATTPNPGAENTAVAVSFDLSEGDTGGDRKVSFDLENCYFESHSTPVSIGGGEGAGAEGGAAAGGEGVIEMTINGFGLAGLTDGAVKVPCRFWTVA